jgi:hypothetical protein
MKSCDDAKAHAKKLTDVLSGFGYKISHSHALEVVAKFNGYKDWNRYVASFTRGTELKPIPSSWRMSGRNLKYFESGKDESLTKNGMHPVMIRSRSGIENIQGEFATLMQSCKADNYREKRIQLKADLMAKNCEGSVTIWLRADGDVKYQYVAFENLETIAERGSLSGTTNWQSRQIVLDIPDQAITLHYGFYLSGQGAGYAANFSLEIVDEDVPVTSSNQAILSAPENLLFE